jgi:hypothetical protein
VDLLEDHRLEGDPVGRLERLGEHRLEERVEQRIALAHAGVDEGPEDELRGVAAVGIGAEDGFLASEVGHALRMASSMRF